MTRELARYKVDIAALIKTRLPDKGQLSGTGGGYTFLSGRSVDKRREVGIGSAMKSLLAKKLASILKDRNDRLMNMYLLLVNGRTATLIRAYTPTMTSPD